MEKKVSIIMPCYNQGVYIEEAVESVKKQTYGNIELVIVNDGSTEEFTLKKLKEIEAAGEENIKVLNTPNCGLAQARNNGIKASTGHYILPLDGDDKIQETYVEKAVAAIEKSRQIGVVYCISSYFGEKTGIWPIPDFSRDLMLIDNLVFCTALYRREDYNRTKGYNPNMKFGLEDWDFWLSMMELGLDFYRIDEVLFHYRFKRKSMLRELKERKLLMRAQAVRNHPQLYLDNLEGIIRTLEKESFVDNLKLRAAIYRQKVHLKKLDKNTKRHNS
ncbi:MAG: glycosyltransferase family A protein [Bacillota bacterium]|nr:glycosyltransferase family A protein [Bacillota bacterium]